MMREEVTYWNTKLEKIQYALMVVRSIINGRDPLLIEESLEKQEESAFENLIKAEQTEEA